MNFCGFEKLAKHSIFVIDSYLKDNAVKRDTKLKTRFVKGLPFVNKRHTWQMVYTKEWGLQPWGRASLCLNICWWPHTPTPTPTPTLVQYYTPLPSLHWQFHLRQLVSESSLFQTEKKNWHKLIILLIELLVIWRHHINDVWPTHY